MTNSGSAVEIFELRGMFKEFCLCIIYEECYSYIDQFIYVCLFHYNLGILYNETKQSISHVLFFSISHVLFLYTMTNREIEGSYLKNYDSGNK